MIHDELLWELYFILSNTNWLLLNRTQFLSKAKPTVSFLIYCWAVKNGSRSGICCPFIHRLAIINDLTLGSRKPTEVLLFIFIFQIYFSQLGRKSEDGDRLESSPSRAVRPQADFRSSTPSLPAFPPHNVPGKTN